MRNYPVHNVRNYANMLAGSQLIAANSACRIAGIQDTEAVNKRNRVDKLIQTDERKRIQGVLTLHRKPSCCVIYGNDLRQTP